MERFDISTYVVRSAKFGEYLKEELRGDMSCWNVSKVEGTDDLFYLDCDNSDIDFLKQKFNMEAVLHIVYMNDRRKAMEKLGLKEGLTEA